MILVIIVISHSKNQSAKFYLISTKEIMFLPWFVC